MAKRKKRPVQTDETPGGATKRASDRSNRGGGPPPGQLVDRHAVGTPGGGTEAGGLAGSNFGDGTPDERELADAAAGAPAEADEEQAYSGFSGGAVGGTPAGSRASGGRKHGGIRPGGVHPGDSTIGTDPYSKTE